MEILVLGGGGSRGCFQAGFLYETFDSIKFDRIYGTSTGSLNSLMLAQCYLDRSPERLKDIWLNQIKSRKNIYKYNYTNLLMLKGPCTYSPLKKLMKKNIDLEKICFMKEYVSLTTTDLVSGETIFFNNETSLVEDFRTASIATAVIPPAFSPIKLRDMSLVDGGVRENVPLSKAIRDIDKNNKHRMLVVVCNQPTPEIKECQNFNIINSSLRSVDLMMNEISKNDLRYALKINDIINHVDVNTKRKLRWMRNKKMLNLSLIVPDERNVTSGVLNFIPEEIESGFEKGREAGREHLKSLNLNSYKDI